MSVRKRLTAAAVLGLLAGAAPVATAGAAGGFGAPVAGPIRVADPVAFPAVVPAPAPGCTLLSVSSFTGGDRSAAGLPSLYFRRPGAMGPVIGGPCLPKPFPR